MISNTNRQIVLAARPVGAPKETDFRLVEGPVPTPADGELLVRTIWLSLDPICGSAWARTSATTRRSRSAT